LLFAGALKKGSKSATEPGARIGHTRFIISSITAATVLPEGRHPTVSGKNGSRADSCSHSDTLDTRYALSAALSDFQGNLWEASENRPPSEPIPETVRLAWRLGDAAVLVMEQKPVCHTVRWLADDSPVPIGRGAKYREARLAFPSWCWWWPFMAAI
jgi:hypothetical protein